MTLRRGMRLFPGALRQQVWPFLATYKNTARRWESEGKSKYSLDFPRFPNYPLRSRIGEREDKCRRMIGVVIDRLVSNQEFGCRSQRLAATSIAGVARMCPTGHLQTQAAHVVGHHRRSVTCPADQHRRGAQKSRCAPGWSVQTGLPEPGQ